jgi:hypothetical protein
MVLSIEPISHIKALTVNLICRNLMITLDTILTASIHKGRCPHDVCLKEYTRILDGTVNVALSRKELTTMSGFSSSKSL